MKKKLLLLAVLVVALACLFIVSASAEELPYSTTDAYGTVIELETPIGNTGISNLKNDGTIARTVLTDGNGKYYTVPTIYVLTEHTKDRGDGVKGEMFNFSFGEITTLLGFTVEKTSIIRIEFPKDIKFICSGNENLSGCSNMVECVMNEGVYFWDNSDQRKVFTNCKKLKSIDVSKMVMDRSQTTFAMFEYCEELEYVKLPDAYYDESTSTYMDYNTCHMFSGCKKLKTIENMEGFFKGDKTLNYKTFYNCQALTSIVLNDGLETIDGRAIGCCTSLTSIIIPDTVKTIGTNETVFEAGTSLQKVVFPSGAVSVGSYAFEKCTGLTDIWMPGAGSTFAVQVFGQCGSSTAVNFYFTTATSTITISDSQNKNDPFISAISAENDARIKYNTPLSTKCTVFLDGHHASDATADCTENIVCKDCTIVITEAFDGHDVVITIVYENGFTSDGVKTTACSRQGCTACDKSETALAIFSAKGYSYKESGSKRGLSGGFEVNVDAFNEYKKANLDKTITLSVLMVNPNYINEESDFFSSEGQIIATGGAIQLEITELNYASLDFRVDGFTLAYMQNLEIAFALVVCEDGEVEVIQKQYAQGETSNVCDTYTDKNGIKLDSVTVQSIAPEVVEALKKEQEQA